MTRAAALKAASRAGRDVPRESPVSAGLTWVAAVAIAVVGYFLWGALPTTKKKKVQEETPNSLDFLRDALQMGKEGKGGGGGFSAFSSSDYWEEVYKKSDTEFDAFGRWDIIAPVVAPYMPRKEGGVLNVGCGNSRLAEELHVDGYRNVTNVDISATVISQMAKRHSSLGQQFLQMDITKMTFPDESFDVAIDKGTFDALYSGSLPAVSAGVAEIKRVLKPTGVFICVTFGNEATRRELKAANWAWYKTLPLISKDNFDVSLHVAGKRE